MEYKSCCIGLAPPVVDEYPLTLADIQKGEGIYKPYNCDPNTRLIVLIGKDDRITQVLYKGVSKIKPAFLAAWDRAKFKKTDETLYLEVK